MHQCLLQWLLLCTVSVEAAKIEFNGSSFTNMEVYDGKIYIGAANNILVLNATDLKTVKSVSTCTKECYNINKVLLINEKLEQLITCGTEHGGICEIRNLSSIDNILSQSTYSTVSLANHLVVSTDEKRPACFVLSADSNVLFTGVTYGSGIIRTTSGSYGYYLAKFRLTANKFVHGGSDFLNLYLHETDVEDYLVYLKTVFQHQGFIYFLTNQRFKVGASTYSSKLIRVCENDTYFSSYTDISLRCTKDNTDYNLIQDISVLEPGEGLGILLNTSEKIMAATFAVGSDPEHLDGPSAVCLYTIEEINRKIIETKKNFITCPSKALPITERYLPDHRNGRCLNTTLRRFEEGLFVCDKAFGIFSYITGDEASTLSAAPVYRSTTTKKSDYFGKIQAFVTGNHLVMHVGTSLGYLLKMNVNSEQADVYEREIVDDGYPVTGIHIEEEGKIEYIMSSTKIVRYETKDCSMYTTCEETMAAKNPLCGWCVYESKSTFNDKTTCPYQSYNGHWLSSLSRCLLLNVEPKGISVNRVARVKARLIDVLPEKLPGDYYECVIRGTVQVRNTEVHGPFECKTPYTAAHSEGEAQIFVNHNNRKILLAETDFLFYECGHYKRCSECLEDDRANCIWDSINTVCIESNQTDYTLIFRPDKCPQFQNSEDIHFLPSGVSKELSFNVTNLVNSSDTEYACRLNGKQVEAKKASDNQITCKLEEFAGNVEVLEYEIEILYGTSVFDKKNKVIVFNCGKLGTDCSVCRSLKYVTSAYECDWCSGSCTYSANNCLDVCNPPTITRIVPNTAALNGHISVTIYGTELGSEVEEVQSITLAGVPCERNQDHFIPSERVTCTARASSDALSGKVIVVTNNQSSTGTVLFSYKMPNIEGLIPTKGPMAGGTRLTITGTDLGVGRRNVTVNVNNGDQEHKECTNAQVMPDVELEIDASSLPFHIECDSPPGTIDTQLEAIEVLFDGSTLVTSNSTFTYLENPEIEGITPKKGIASGGNSLTVIGRNLKNAYTGHIEANRVTIACILNSQTEIQCAVPALSLKLKEELSSREGSPSEATVMTEIAIHLDGVSISYSISYYVDPVFYQFNDDQNIEVFGMNQQTLHIMGENLNLVAGEGDVIVTIGVAACEVIQLSESNITCLPPLDQPIPTIPDAPFPEVNVSIGNVHSTVGYLKYTVKADVSKDTTTVITAVTVSSVVVIIVIVAIFLVIYKKNIKKVRKYEQQDIPLKQTLQEERSTESRQAGVKASESPVLVGVDENMQLILQEHHLLIDRQRLQLGDLLGRGHFGSVYKGNLLDTVDDKTTLVAVKTLHQNCPREIDVQAFLDEALIMKDFRHPRVLNLIGICLGMDAMPLVVLPYIPRGDLLSFVRDHENNLSIRDVLDYGKDISEGMTYLSNLKFVHRDLAARNCMLDEMLHVKVADFGLSRDIYEKTYYSSDNKKTMLPVKWLALECLEKGKYTSKSDVWSFGIVMWEMFTRGAHPYPEVDNWDIIRYLKNGRRLQQPQFCPDQIFKMMQNCWLPDPTDRPTFSLIEQTIKDIVSVLEHDMKQGVGKANIQSTYVNIDSCTEYIFTETKTPLYDGDGFLSATTARTVSSDAGKAETGLDQAPSSSYQSLDSALSEISGYDTLETKS